MATCTLTSMQTTTPNDAAGHIQPRARFQAAVLGMKVAALLEAALSLPAAIVVEGRTALLFMAAGARLNTYAVTPEWILSTSVTSITVPATRW